jgi:hypothetical protein
MDSNAALSNFSFGHPDITIQDVFAFKVLLDVTSLLWYTSFTFDENLQLHINRDLADNVGRASDTS